VTVHEAAPMKWVHRSGDAVTFNSLSASVRNLASRLLYCVFADSPYYYTDTPGIKNETSMSVPPGPPLMEVSTYSLTYKIMFAYQTESGGP